MDIPVADFTFGCYPQTSYLNDSWGGVQVNRLQHRARLTRCWSTHLFHILLSQSLCPTMQALLQHKSDMVSWQKRRPAIFLRGSPAGPRQAIVTAFSKLRFLD